MTDSWPLYALAAVLAVQPPGEPLRPAGSFGAIPDRQERSLALFAEASKVLLHPRCANCHPPDDQPRLGDRHLAHDPPAVRGPSGDGVPAMACASCHQDRNLEQIWEHSARNALVAWGWKPGHGRTPAPGTQKEFGDLIRAWIDTGAACPPATEATR